MNELLNQLEEEMILSTSGKDIGQAANLQRTDEWFEQRRAKFTGSELYKLMKTSRSTAKKEWGRLEKRVDFGTVAEKYIFSKCMEAKTGKIIRSRAGTAANYGKKMEDVVVQKFLQQEPVYTFQPVGFTEFLPGIAGASPDGLFIDQLGNKIGAEIKCPVDFESFFPRIQTIDESHQDFWQVQGEMLALQVEKLIYIVAEPNEDIVAILTGKQEAKIDNLNTQIVHASPIHQRELIERCKIGRKVIELFLTHNYNIHELIKIAINENN